MKRIGLDAADIRILCAVQQHGQLSKAKLAEIANISATPCWARLDRLKAAGLIRGYHGDIVIDRVCDVTQVMVTVSLTHHRKGTSTGSRPLSWAGTKSRNASLQAAGWITC